MDSVESEPDSGAACRWASLDVTHKRVLVPASLHLAPRAAPQTSSGTPGTLAEGETLWHFKCEEHGREMMLVWEQTWAVLSLPARLQGGMALPCLLRTAKCVLCTFEFPRCWASLSSLMAAAAFFSFSSSPAVSKA